MSYFEIKDEWRVRLEKAGLGSLQEALAFEGGKLLSKKSRSRTWLYTLPDGQRVFVKQDTRGRFEAGMRALLRFQKPLSATEREYAKMQKLSGMGFRLATAVLRGAQRRLGFWPFRAVMVTLPVPGRSVDEISHSGLPEKEVRAAISKALQTLKQLWEKGCDWGKDAKPEHFFLDENGDISLIDVERMHFHSSPLPQKTRDAQLKRFRELL